MKPENFVKKILNFQLKNYFLFFFLCKNVDMSVEIIFSMWNYFFTKTILNLLLYFWFLLLFLLGVDTSRSPSLSSELISLRYLLLSVVLEDYEVEGTSKKPSNDESLSKFTGVAFFQSVWCFLVSMKKQKNFWGISYLMLT